MSLAAALNLPTATAEHPRDKLARMIALVRARRVTSGATIRTAHAANAYRLRCARLAERAIVNHPTLAADLARAAALVGPDAPNKHALATVQRIRDSRALLSKLSGADSRTVAAAFARLACKGTDAGAAARLSVTVPEGITLPAWIPADGGCWYACPHLAPGRYQWSTRTVAQMEAWAESLPTRERERALPSPVLRRPSPLALSATAAAESMSEADTIATKAATMIAASMNAADALADCEDNARAAETPADARAAWSKADRLASLAACARDQARDLARNADTLRAQSVARTRYLFDRPAVAKPATVQRTGFGGVTVYAPARQQEG